MVEVSQAPALPRFILEKARREAEKLGMSIEEYLLEVMSRDLDPREKSREFIEAAKKLLDAAVKELRKGDVRQAAEKTWGAAALSVKAYAYWREGRRLASHGELWEYVEVIARELGDWVRNSWNEATAMHVCFYEGWCQEKQVEAAVKQVEKLVNGVMKKIIS